MTLAFALSPDSNVGVTKVKQGFSMPEKENNCMFLGGFTIIYFLTTKPSTPPPYFYKIYNGGCLYLGLYLGYLQVKMALLVYDWGSIGPRGL